METGSNARDIVNKIYIAGAHSRAQTLRAYLEYLDPGTEVASYLVDDLSGNRPMIDRIPVRLITDEGLDRDYTVYIGTRGENQPKITKELKAVGFDSIIPVTVELDRRLRNEYVCKAYRLEGRAFRMINSLDAVKKDSERSAKIYVACSVLDKSLQKEYRFIDDECMIQVGAALADTRAAPEVITDDTGDNISTLNKQYCELTGLYWLWKNAIEDYIGLVHYRRHFLLPDDWLARLERNRIDAVLPVPLYAAPNIGGNYRERHDAADWDYMMEYLKKNDAEEYQKAAIFFETNLYFPCNMFILKREVLDELCEWLFPILFAVAAHGGQKEDSYSNRYPGFISERLISFFFEKHRDRYRIAFADKNFLT